MLAGLGQYPEPGGAAVLPGGAGPDGPGLQLHSAQRDLAHAVRAGPAAHHVHAHLPHLLPQGVIRLAGTQRCFLQACLSYSTPGCLCSFK